MLVPCMLLRQVRRALLLLTARAAATACCLLLLLLGGAAALGALLYQGVAERQLLPQRSDVRRVGNLRVCEDVLLPVLGYLEGSLFMCTGGRGQACTDARTHARNGVSSPRRGCVAGALASLAPNAP